MPYKQKHLRVKSAFCSPDTIIGMQASTYHIIASHCVFIIKISVHLNFIFSFYCLISFVICLLELCLVWVVSVPRDLRFYYYPPSPDGNVCLYCLVFHSLSILVNAFFLTIFKGLVIFQILSYFNCYSKIF